MTTPDYAGGGITNLMSSLVHGFDGVDTGYPPLRLLDGLDLGEWQSVVLLVIDGLGFNYLMERGKGSCLKSNLAGAMTSVCPSTTTSAIPTFLTGLPPQQHGLTGWFTWFSEIGTILSVLPFKPRDHRIEQWGDATPNQLVGVPPVFGRMAANCSTVMPDRIADSAFNRAFSGTATVRPYKDIQGFCDQIVRAVSGSGRNYVYGYWPEFDGLAHGFGIKSGEVYAHFGLIDRAVSSILRRLKKRKALLLVTADHGFVDVMTEDRISLEQHPELGRTLERPLCGEPRLAFCYVKPEHRASFEGYIIDRLDHCVLAKRSEELLGEGWFGRGTAHPQLRDRIGDYALIMKRNCIIKDTLPGESPFRQIGVHGGLSADEMYVPLILLEP